MYLQSLYPPVPPIPDDLTIAQFVLDATHPTRAPWSHAMRPWLIEEATGRQIGSDEVRVGMGCSVSWGSRVVRSVVAAGADAGAVERAEDTLGHRCVTTFRWSVVTLTSLHA